MKNRNKLLWLLSAALLGCVLFYLFRPKPLLVETAVVHRGPLREVAEEEGKTRMHDHFIVASTVGGKTRRIELHAGDKVHTGQVITLIDPAPIDLRESAVLEARLNAARAGQKQAQAAFAKAENEHEQTQRDLSRGRSLWGQGIISKEAYEKAVTLDSGAAQQLEQAREGVQVASFQVDEARASLLAVRDSGSELPTEIRSPVEGRVLRVIEQSERIVAPGIPLVEIGYSPHLEIVSDYLTREAARIQPGMPALITDWGGNQALHAHVRTIEPGGFTKVSALGVEEQRANVVLDFDQPPAALQDGFHVQVGVITWESADVLLIPSSAVFRTGTEWAAFVVDNGVARMTKVKIGHRGDELWEVEQGITPGTTVIVHPATEVVDGAPVRAR